MTTRRVHKYALTPEPSPHHRGAAVATINVSNYYQIVHVAHQNDTPTLWAIVDPNDVRNTQTFYIVPTGVDIPPKATHHISTWQNGPYVWHLFHGPHT